MMLDVSTVPEKLNEFDGILATRFRRDVVADCNQRVKAAVDRFNADAQQTARELDAERDELAASRNELNARHAALEASAARLAAPPASDAADAVSRHNRGVAEHNARAAEHRELAARYEARQADFNGRVRASNAELERRGQEVERLQERVRQELGEYQAWRAARGEEQFFREVSRLYADLCEGLPDAGSQTGAIRAYLTQVKVFRSELATWARRREQEAEHGVLIVPALVAGTEECHLVVDTGATTVALSPEMIRAAGLADRLGAEVEVVVAGGVHVRGRSMTLPSLSVQGMEARDVEAVELDPSQCGVDGLLGLSFLNHFNYSVERERPQRLRLAFKGEALHTYDVFISYNSADEWWARVVFDALTVMGYRPFLADLSLRELHDAEFGRAIEAAVSSARHLVVVGTSAERLTSPWVEKEWRFFIHQKLTHGKPGNVVSVLCGSMRVEDLPAGLGYYQAVRIAERDFRERLKDFLPLV